VRNRLSAKKQTNEHDNESNAGEAIGDSFSEAAKRSGKREEKGLAFRTVKNIFSKQRKIALIIDAPNILRRVNNKQIRLEDIEKIANKLGQIKIAKVILNRHAPRSLLKAIENSGYEPIVASTDIYIRMAIEVMDSV
jgi:uncharacterized protein (TIGR00288 family)